MKKLSRDKERQLENYIHDHHSTWSLYFLGGRQRIPFSLEVQIKAYREKAKEEAKNTQIRGLTKELRRMNQDKYQFLLNLSEKFDGDDSAALAYWIERGKYHKMLKESNLGSPKQEKKDNKGIKVGSGGRNKNMIRYPKKCRKTAWKRFYKLFPMLDPKNKETE